HHSCGHPRRKSYQQIKPARLLRRVQGLPIPAVWQSAAIIKNRRSRFHTHQKSFFPEDRFLLRLALVLLDLFFSELRLFSSILGRRRHKRDDVMHYLAIAWTSFGHLNVNVLFEVSRDFEVLVLVGP